MPPKKDEEGDRPAPLSAAVTRSNHTADVPFPHPDLFFKVYESEEDEPSSKVRKDVLRLQVWGWGQPPMAVPWPQGYAPAYLNHLCPHQHYLYACRRNGSGKMAGGGQKRWVNIHMPLLIMAAQ